MVLVYHLSVARVGYIDCGVSDRRAHDDPVRPENRDWFVRTLTGLCDGSAVCGWGTHGAYRGHDTVALGCSRELGFWPVELGLTKDGHLNYRLYVL